MMNTSTQVARLDSTARRSKGVDYLLMWLIPVISITYVNALEVQQVNAGELLESPQKIRGVPSIAAILAMVGGVFMAGFGYKWFRTTLFASGFLLGGLVAALAVEFLFGKALWIALGSWISFGIGGIVAGCLVLWFYNVGVSLVGATAGVLLAFVANSSFGYRLLPAHPDAMLVILMVVFAGIGAFAAWKLEKPVLIVATSFIGAQAAVWGLGYFAGKYPSGADLERFRVQVATSDGTGTQWIYHIPYAWWLYLTASMVLWLVGMYVQFFKTSRDGVYHRRRDSKDTAMTSASIPQHGIDNDNDMYFEASTPRGGIMVGAPVQHV